MKRSVTSNGWPFNPCAAGKWIEITRIVHKVRSRQASRLSVSLLVAILLLIYLQLYANSAEPNIIEIAPGQYIPGEITLRSGNQSEISIQAPDQILGWSLNRSQPISTRPGTLTVNATGSWQIFVSSDSFTGGHLTEYNTSTAQFIAGGRKLISPMKIAAEGGNEVDLSRGGDLVQGYGRKTIPVNFTQELRRDDKALPKGNEYRIFLIFTASPGLDEEEGA